jgi:hypothetical protein
MTPEERREAVRRRKAKIAHERKTGEPWNDSNGFDVVCTIGRVEFGTGDMSPYVAAFVLIAEHDANGTFQFPNEDGTITSVTVER